MQSASAAYAPGPVGQLLRHWRTPKDVTLQELRIETFFPADAKSEAVWKEVVGDSLPAKAGSHTYPIVTSYL
jgi:hypothetical protein